jgi:hypothetical protein
MRPAAVTLASTTASRVAQLLRLLGSDRPGEITAAVAALNRVLSGAGMDVHDLADVAESGLQSAPPSAPQLPPADDIDVAAMIRFCFDRTDWLTERELGFVRNMHRQLRLIGDDFEPTEKQLKWLLVIEQRLRSQP